MTHGGGAYSSGFTSLPICPLRPSLLSTWYGQAQRIRSVPSLMTHRFGSSCTTQLICLLWFTQLAPCCFLSILSLSMTQQLIGLFSSYTSASQPFLNSSMSMKESKLFERSNLYGEEPKADTCGPGWCTRSAWWIGTTSQIGSQTKQRMISLLITDSNYFFCVWSFFAAT